MTGIMKWMPFAILLLISGCRRVDNVVYSEFVSFGEEGWNPVRTVEFMPWPLDSVHASSDRYDILVSVRFNPAEAPAALPLLVRQEDNEGNTVTDTLRIPLRDGDGDPLGRRSLVLYDNSVTFRKDTAITEGFALELVSLLPMEKTKGIKDLGIQLIDRKPRKPSPFKRS